MSSFQYNSLLAGPRNFIVGSNLTAFFAIGDFMKQDDFYALGYFKNDGNFVIDGKLFSSDGGLIASIKDMKPEVKTDNLQQLNSVEDANSQSLEIIDKKGNRVLYARKTNLKIILSVDKFKLGPPIVEINGELYDKSGQLIANGTSRGLVVHKGKMVMGATKTGSLGIVMGCSQDETNFIRNFVKEHIA